MGILRRGGLIGQIVGSVLLAVGTIFPGIGLPLQAVGYVLLTASTIATVVDPPKPPKIDDRLGGAGHAFGSYWNPADESAEVR